jgi:hypothetical protein
MDKHVSSAAPWLNKSGSDELLNGIFNRGYVLPVVMQKGKLDMACSHSMQTATLPRFFLEI